MGMSWDSVAGQLDFPSAHRQSRDSGQRAPGMTPWIESGTIHSSVGAARTTAPKLQPNLQLAPSYIRISIETASISKS